MWQLALQAAGAFILLLAAAAPPWPPRSEQGDGMARTPPTAR